MDQRRHRPHPEEFGLMFRHLLLGRIGCHYGVSCNSCSVENMFGYRYKCAICEDFDLCSSCFEDRKEVETHKSNHPMKVLRSPDAFFHFGRMFALGLPRLQAYLCERRITHDVICKSCANGKRIQGILFICDDCRGYSLCYGCFESGKIVGRHGKGHCLIIRVAPKDYRIKSRRIAMFSRIETDSFGDMFKCKVDGATAAIKVCKMSDLSTLTEIEKDSLENEIQIYQEFSSEFIVEIRGFGISARNEMFLVLEHFPKGNLEKYLETPIYSKESKRRRFYFCECFIRGLARLHKKGIIHKNLKPGSLFLTDYKTLKLGEFGIAFHPDWTPQEIQDVFQNIYYPPNKENSCHPSYDIYAFGLIINEIMTGQKCLHLTQNDCKDVSKVPYFGALISACLSRKGRERPSTECVKKYILSFRQHLDDYTKRASVNYEQEQLEKRNEIFDQSYSLFSASKPFVNETVEGYAEVPTAEGKKESLKRRSLFTNRFHCKSFLQ